MTYSVTFLKRRHMFSHNWTGVQNWCLLSGPVANAPWCTSASAAYCTYPALDVPTFAASRLSRPHPASHPGSQSRNYAGEKWLINFAEMPHETSRDLLHAVNQRHWTHGFSSLLKEGALRIFSPWKIRRLQPGLISWTWVPKASALTPRRLKPLKLVSESVMYMHEFGVWGGRKKEKKKKWWPSTDICR
jgi:hypothetical protein